MKKKKEKEKEEASGGTRRFRVSPLNLEAGIE